MEGQVVKSNQPMEGQVVISNKPMEGQVVIEKPTKGRPGSQIQPTNGSKEKHTTMYCNTVYPALNNP